MGHCGMKDYSKPTREARALIKIFANGKPIGPKLTSDDFEYVWAVNDKINGYTPKENILTHLNTLKVETVEIIEA